MTTVEGFRSELSLPSSLEGRGPKEKALDRLELDFWGSALELQPSSLRL